VARTCTVAIASTAPAAISNSFAFGGHNVALVIAGPPTTSHDRAA
jgi:3-oxoacyl-(acyl-carrier-protein) synthase